MMDMSHLIQVNTTFDQQEFIKNKQPSLSVINQTCNLPDSTTESPTATQMDSLILPNQLTHDFQQLASCQSNQLLVSGKDSNVLDSDGLEDFRNLISDVSVSVMVDSTQPTNTLADIPPFIDNGPTIPVSNYQQYVTQNQNTQQQVTQNTISQIIQPEVFKDQQKVPQHLVGNVDQCISRILPDFSNYPPNCKCDYIDKIVAVEQIWVCDRQMYFLPQIGIIVIGNREYAGIFHDQKKGYIALGEVIEKMIPQYKSDLISFLERMEDLDQYELSPQELGYLQQRQCISEGCKYTCAISLSMLRQIAQFIAMYESDKPTFNSGINDIANSNYYRKILQRHVRCGSCGGVILYNQEPDEYVMLKTDISEGKNEAKCFSVGFIHACDTKFVAFKTDNRIYISVKELCQKHVLRLQVLQARLGALRQRPRLAPSVLNNYLNTPEYNVKNTMWIDIATLRCVCCMGKCSPGLNAEVYSCFARVNFTEHIVTNIYGVDDHESEGAVFTMNPKTFEVVMKKTSMKSDSRVEPPKKTNKVKTKSNLKSFELSSKQTSGYESPERLNESAFLYEKSFEESMPEQTSFVKSKPKSATKKTNLQTNSKADKAEKTFIFEDKDSAIEFLTKSSILGNDAKSSSMQNGREANKKKNKKGMKKLPGKSPTFKVKPAERPYKYEEPKKEENSKIKITLENNRYVVSLSTPTSTQDSSKQSKKKSKSSSKLSPDLARGQNSEQYTENNSIGHVGQNVEINTPQLDGDETRYAITQLVEELEQDSPVAENGENADHVMTPMTESRILSRIDLNGSINEVFQSPPQGNVVVEMMDTNENQPFSDSTSPLSRLYNQYEQFERLSSVSREATPETMTNNMIAASEAQSLDTETSENQTVFHFSTADSKRTSAMQTHLQFRNETEMPIDVSNKVKTVQEKVAEAKSALDNLTIKMKKSPAKDLQKDKNGHMNLSEDNILSSSAIVDKPSENISSPLFNSDYDQIGQQKSLSPNIVGSPKAYSEDRQKRAKTLSPPKGGNSTPTSPFVTKLTRTTSLSSPVFKKSGEIDRAHAKVQKLTELEDKSQPLDLLASLAQVITDESDSQCFEEEEDRNVGQGGQEGQEDPLPVDQGTNSCSNKDKIESQTYRQNSEMNINVNNFETCAISDENSNIDKILLEKQSEKLGPGLKENNDPLNNLLEDIEKVEKHILIEPYKDSNSGHWKVRFQLKPNAKDAFPELFGDETDKKKRNMFLALLGKVYLAKHINGVINYGLKQISTESFSSLDKELVKTSSDYCSLEKEPVKKSSDCPKPTKMSSHRPKLKSTKKTRSLSDKKKSSKKSVSQKTESKQSLKTEINSLQQESFNKAKARSKEIMESPLQESVISKKSRKRPNESEREGKMTKKRKSR